MLILHEHLTKEAEHIAQAINTAYGVPSRIIDGDLSNRFEKIPAFDGYYSAGESFVQKDSAVRVVTPRDIYARVHSRPPSQEDDWIFGYCYGLITLLSTARVKGETNKPSNSLEIEQDRYLNRLATFAVHEIGHDVVTAKHLKFAHFVNAKTGIHLPLGDHCTDNQCVMYEVIDVKAPPKEEGYLDLGGESKFDAGLDEQIARMRPGWFCTPCKESIKLTPAYYSSRK